MSFLKRFNADRSRVPAPGPAALASVPTPAPSAPPAAAQSAGSGGLPVWMLGVVLVVVLIVVACAGFLLLSEPVPQEVVVQPTVIFKPGQTAVVLTPVPGVVTSSEEEGGSPFGIVIIFGLVVVAILGGGYALFGLPFSRPWIYVPPDKLQGRVNRFTGSIERCGIGFQIIPRGIYILLPILPATVFSVPIKDQVVAYKAPKGRGNYVDGQLDAEPFLQIDDLSTFIKKCGTLDHAKDLVRQRIAGVLEMIARRHTFAETAEDLFRSEIRTRFESVVKEWGLVLTGVEITNTRITDAEVLDAMRQKTVVSAGVDANKASARSRGQTLFEMAKGAGVNERVTMQDVIMFMALNPEEGQPGMTLQGLLAMFMGFLKDARGVNVPVTVAPAPSAVSPATVASPLVVSAAPLARDLA